MVRAFIGLGSNLGDRQANLDFAIAELDALPGVNVLRGSSAYETAPVGPVKQDDFLNAVAEIETELPAETLLDQCLSIELKAGRKRLVHWGPRTLDLDLLDYGQQTIRTDRLTLPHPEAQGRAFVLAPWAELTPEFMLHGKCVAQWLTEVDQAGVRRVTD